MITAKGKIFLITSTSASLGRFIRHKGILFKYDHDLYVVHRTIKGLEIITYKEFLSTRQLLFYRSYLLKNEVNIEDLVRRHKYNRYKLILVFLLTLALLTGIGVTTTISALTVILIFLTVISSNWDYVK